MSRGIRGPGAVPGTWHGARSASGPDGHDITDCHGPGTGSWPGPLCQPSAPLEHILRARCPLDAVDPKVNRVRFLLQRSPSSRSCHGEMMVRPRAVQGCERHFFCKKRREWLGPPLPGAPSIARPKPQCQGRRVGDPSCHPRPRQDHRDTVSWELPHWTISKAF